MWRLVPYTPPTDQRTLLRFTEAFASSGAWNKLTFSGYAPSEFPRTLLCWTGCEPAVRAIFPKLAKSLERH